MTLTQAAILTKRGIVIFSAAIFLIVVARVGYNIWYQYYLSTLPPVEEKPEMRFGPLPSLKFPSDKVSSSNFSYSLDTATGELPQMPKMIKVYFMPQGNLSLLAPERSKQLAQSLGFTIGPKELTPTVHQFEDEDGGTLLINLPTGNFHLQRKQPVNASSSAQLAADTDIGKDKITRGFKNFLISKKLWPEELTGNESIVINEDPNNIEPTIISLWPPKIDGLPLTNPLFKYSLLRASLVSESGYYPEINYTYWPVDLTTYSTYPVKTVDQAFSQLQGGKGFISLDPKTPNVSITSIYLAYYQTDEYTPYLQPVFVFEGPEFAAFVPAIANP